MNLPSHAPYRPARPRGARAFAGWTSASAPVLRMGLGLGMAVALLAGCGSAPAILPPAKTTLVSTAIVGPAVNPDHRKRPSPVIVRVYELKSTALFESTDFVTLFEKDQSALGPELLSREEFVLRPNDVKAINKTLSPEARFIGVVAGFRDLERARWRVSAPVVANQRNTLKIRVDDVNVTITRDE